MRHVHGLATILLLLAFGGATRGQTATDPGAFDGVWLGEIAGPNVRTKFGLAFTPTARGRLVSVYFPEMFLHSANFGVAEFPDGGFRLRALDLNLKREGDRLVGTFAPARLAVELHRGGSFAAAPAAPEPPPPPAPAWSLQLGAPAWASPVVLDQTIYVGTTDGKMHAVSVDGHRVWTWSGPNPLYGAAAANADGIYVVDAEENLISLNRADGILRWRMPLRTPAPAVSAATPADPTFNHRTVVPVIDAKGVLYVGSSDGGISAIRSRNGKPVWRYEARAPIHSALTLAGEDLWAGCFDGTVLRLNRRAPRETLRVKLAGPIVSAPVVAGDRVVVGGRDYMLYGLGTSDGAVKWRDTFWFSWVESEPRVVGSLLFIGGSDYRRVSAIDASTGIAKWATDVGGLSWGSPLVTEDTVYAGTAGQTIEGTVIAHRGGIVALNRETGAVKWRYRTATSSDKPFSGFTGSLALVDGRLVVGAGVDGTLIAFPLSVP